MFVFECSNINECCRLNGSITEKRGDIFDCVERGGEDE